MQEGIRMDKNRRVSHCMSAPFVSSWSSIWFIIVSISPAFADTETESKYSTFTEMWKGLRAVAHQQQSLFCTHVKCMIMYVCPCWENQAWLRYLKAGGGVQKISNGHLRVMATLGSVFDGTPAARILRRPTMAASGWPLKTLFCTTDVCRLVRRASYPPPYEEN